MSVREFYYLGITLASLFGAFGLIALWRIISRKDQEGSKGIFFVILAIFSWAVVGAYKLINPEAFSILNTITNRVLSAFSNLCLLASLPYFTESFARLKDRSKLFRDANQWLLGLLVFFSALTVAFVLLDNMDKEGTYVNKYIIIVVDTFISILAMMLVSYSIYHSIKKYWTSPLSRAFAVAVFSMFLATQIAFPVIGFALGQESAIFYYHVTLSIFIISLGLLVTILISYYSLVAYEITLAAAVTQNEVQILSDRYQPNSLRLGFDQSKAVYFLEITFVSSTHNGNRVVDRIEFKKVLKPFCHWIVFALAKQRGIGLENVDMAIIKFRMLSLWNKDAKHKLVAEDLFDINDFTVSFKFDYAEIIFDGKEHLYSRFVIRDTFKGFLQNFFPEIDPKILKTVQTNTEEVEKLVAELFDLNT
jgi:hypothetical protein